MRHNRRHKMKIKNNNNKVINEASNASMNLSVLIETPSGGKQ